MKMSIKDDEVAVTLVGLLSSRAPPMILHVSLTNGDEALDLNILQLKSPKICTSFASLSLVLTLAR